MARFIVARTEGYRIAPGTHHTDVKKNGVTFTVLDSDVLYRVCGEFSGTFYTPSGLKKAEAAADALAARLEAEMEQAA